MDLEVDAGEVNLDTEPLAVASTRFCVKPNPKVFGTRSAFVSYNQQVILSRKF